MPGPSKGKKGQFPPRELLVPGEQVEEKSSLQLLEGTVYLGALPEALGRHLANRGRVSPQDVHICEFPR